jgi:hypothetical protein
MPSQIICAVTSSPIASLTLNHYSHTFKESENIGARAREIPCIISADVFCYGGSFSWPH